MIRSRTTKKPKPVRRQLRTVADVVRPLGSDCNSIARSLQRLGIRGQMVDGYSCPLAKYLRANRYPESARVLTSGVYDIRSGDTLGWFPATVCEFIRRFDDGLYPDLVEDADRG